MDPRATAPRSPSPPPLPLALGTWALAGDGPGAWGYGPCDPDTARSTIRAALDLGCRRFDTAAAFGAGAVERLLGEVLRGRDDVAVTTRIGCRFGPDGPVPDFAPGSLAAQLEASASRLGRAPLDRVLLHLPSPAMLRDGRAWKALVALKAEGRVREIGASVQEPEEALLLAEAGADWLCVPYNPANRKFEGRFFPRVRAFRVAVQVREVLHNGRLTTSPRDPAGFGPADVRASWGAFLLARLAVCRDRIAAARPGVPVERTCIGYALGHSAVTEVVVGCRDPAQVAAAFAAAAALAPETRERVNAALYGYSSSGSPSPNTAASMASISASDSP